MRFQLSTGFRTLHSSLLALVLLALLPLGGCGGKSSPTAPGPIQTLSLRQALDAALPSIVPVPVNLDTTASVLVTLHVPGLKGAGAAFVNNGQLVDAGGVWIHSAAVDSVQLAKTVAGSGTLIIYSTLTGAPPPNVNIAFDGLAYHVFRVGGSISVPAFADSVKSVDDLNVSAPLDNATVPGSGALTVTWSDAGTDTSVKVVATVIANSDTTRKAAAAAVPDPDGTVQIPAVAMMHLPPGPARLSVARYRLVYKTAGGRNTGFACETIDVRNLILN
jgi:hypothetical protein